MVEPYNPYTYRDPSCQGCGRQLLSLERAISMHQALGWFCAGCRPDPNKVAHEEDVK